MNTRPSAGRPSSSRNVRVTPEYLKEPDIEKMGLALIAVARSIDEQKKAGKLALKNTARCCKNKTGLKVPSTGRPGDTMT